ncbi:MAG: T9SS type A sorting domain-containing protein [Candidatus Rifleibacteriota bacterium]
MKKKSIFIYLFFFLSVVSAYAQNQVVKDGTHLLRRDKKRLDAELESNKNSKRAFAIHPLNKSFQVYNFVSGTYEYKPAVLAGEGRHCRIFTEKNRPNPWGDETKVKIRQIVETFDNKVYPTVTSWFGEIIVPKKFLLKDKKIFIFLTDIKDGFKEGYVAGYFDCRDISGLTGNQKPVFFMDTDPGKPGDPTDKNNSFYRTLAHEFQHMVSYSRRLALGLEAQKRWLDEGLSMFSEFMYSGNVGESGFCLPPSPHYERFIESPAVNLFSSSNNSWFKEDLLYRKYGASFLFVTYMIEKFAGNSLKERKKFARSLVEYEIAGADGLDEYLVEKGSSLRELFNNWVLACYLNDKTINSGEWHFNSIKIFPEAETAQLPISLTRHYFEGDSGSFIGAEGQVAANSPAIDSITGKGNLPLNFEFDAEMTPAIALLKKDKTVEFKRSSINENGKFSGNYDLDNIDRLFLLPLVLNSDFEENKKYSYSFKSNPDDLLLYPVANPAFPDQLIIFLRSIKNPLTATPTLNISFNNLVDSPHFYSLDKKGFLFAANYQIPGDGKGKAICHTGQNACSFSFSSASIAGKANVKLNQDNFALQVSSDKRAATPRAMLSIPSVSSLPLSGDIIEGPCDVIFPESACATLSFSLPFNPENGLGVCRINEKGKITTWRNAVQTEQKASALLRSPGRYLLIKDTKPPTLVKFSASNHGNGQVFKFVFKDDISGINFDSLKVSSNDEDLPFTHLDQDSESLKVLYEGFLPEFVDLKIEFADKADNYSAEIRKVAVAPANIKMMNCRVYPNPCRRVATFNMVFNGSIILKDSKITIFDMSGMEVGRLNAVQKQSDRIQARWRLIGKNARRVANGIYFAKVDLNTDKGRFKAKAKFAVVR